MVQDSIDWISGIGRATRGRTSTLGWRPSSRSTRAWSPGCWRHKWKARWVNISRKQIGRNTQVLSVEKLNCQVMWATRSEISSGNILGNVASHLVIQIDVSDKSEWAGGRQLVLIFESDKQHIHNLSLRSEIQIWIHTARTLLVVYITAFTILAVTWTAELGWSEYFPHHLVHLFHLLSLLHLLMLADLAVLSARPHQAFTVYVSSIASLLSWINQVTKPWSRNRINKCQVKVWIKIISA